MLPPRIHPDDFYFVNLVSRAVSATVHSTRRTDEPLCSYYFFFPFPRTVRRWDPPIPRGTLREEISPPSGRLIGSNDRLTRRCFNLDVCRFRSNLRIDAASASPWKPFPAVSNSPLEIRSRSETMRTRTRVQRDIIVASH